MKDRKDIEKKISDFEMIKKKLQILAYETEIQQSAKNGLINAIDSISEDIKLLSWVLS
jgi:hypothetical protein